MRSSFFERILRKIRINVYIIRNIQYGRYFFLKKKWGEMKKQKLKTILTEVNIPTIQNYNRLYKCIKNRFDGI